MLGGKLVTYKKIEVKERIGKTLGNSKESNLCTYMYKNKNADLINKQSQQGFSLSLYMIAQVKKAKVRI